MGTNRRWGEMGLRQKRKMIFIFNQYMHKDDTEELKLYDVCKLLDET
jgi:hypothetical protein